MDSISDLAGEVGTLRTFFEEVGHAADVDEKIEEEAGHKVSTTKEKTDIYGKIEKEEVRNKSKKEFIEDRISSEYKAKVFADLAMQSTFNTVFDQTKKAGGDNAKNAIDGYKFETPQEYAEDYAERETTGDVRKKYEDAYGDSYDQISDSLSKKKK
jgi:hypothetical protein